MSVLRMASIAWAVFSDEGDVILYQSCCGCVTTSTHDCYEILDV